MLKIKILCHGSLKEKYLKDGVADYLKRCSRFASVFVKEVEEKSAGIKESSTAVKKQGELLIKEIEGFSVALVSTGNELDSPGLAEFIDAKAAAGISTITFIIGGSNGLSGEVLAKADYKLSFGKFTYPHQLMRLILAEQLYRALTIRRNITYHK